MGECGAGEEGVEGEDGGGADNVRVHDTEEEDKAGDGEGEDREGYILFGHEV